MTAGAVGPLSRTRATVTYFVYRASAALLRALPAPVSRTVARLAALGAWAARPSRRMVVAANLAPVLGRAPADREVRRAVRRSFLNYGVYWSDAGRVRASDPPRHPERFVIHGEETFLKAAAVGKGMILVLPHVGCWEAGAAWTASVGYPLTTVAEVLEPPELFAWFVEKRKQLELTVLPVAATTVSRLLAELSKGGVIALLADRDVVGDGVPVEFFGQRAKIPGGPALLALRSGAPIHPCAIYDDRGGRYTAEVLAPLETKRSGSLRADVAAVSQEIATAFEDLIRRAPEQWHVFQPLWVEPETTRGKQ